MEAPAQKGSDKHKGQTVLLNTKTGKLERGPVEDAPEHAIQDSQVGRDKRAIQKDTVYCSVAGLNDEGLKCEEVAVAESQGEEERGGEAHIHASNVGGADDLLDLFGDLPVPAAAAAGGSNVGGDLLAIFDHDPAGADPAPAGSVSATLTESPCKTDGGGGGEIHLSNLRGGDDTLDLSQDLPVPATVTKEVATLEGDGKRHVALHAAGFEDNVGAAENGPKHTIVKMGGAARLEAFKEGGGLAAFAAAQDTEEEQSGPESAQKSAQMESAPLRKPAVEWLRDAGAEREVDAHAVGTKREEEPAAMKKEAEEEAMQRRTEADALAAKEKKEEEVEAGAAKKREQEEATANTQEKEEQEQEEAKDKEKQEFQEVASKFETESPGATFI